MATTRLLTVEDLEALGSEAERYELIEGVLRERVPMGGRHGVIEVRILVPLSTWAEPRRLGTVFPSDTHSVILRNPDVTLISDVAFVRAERLPPEAIGEGFVPVPPDLAVEVVSPSDRPGEVQEKIEQYLAAGVPLVWRVDPHRRTVTVHTPGQPPVTLGEGDTLDGGQVVPGFTLPVADIFALVPRSPTADG